jgi:hypothetical protein
MAMLSRGITREGSSANDAPRRSLCSPLLHVDLDVELSVVLDR